MKYYTDENPAWLRWIAPEEFNDAQLFRIVVFYVFHSPCFGSSAMRRPIEEYGWSDPWAAPYSLRKQLIQASNNEKLIINAERYDEMDEKLETAGLKDSFLSNYSLERVCIYDCKDNQTLSLFYHIRNSLAHGRMNMVNVDGECVFVLEDVVKDNRGFKVSARMVLKKSTLLEWIDIIEGGEKPYQKKPSEKLGRKKQEKKT